MNKQKKDKEPRRWSPKLRAATMADRRTKRKKTRAARNREAIANG